ncbi:MAG TPA: metal ABC transporter permease [Opitutaceae bacterium]|nr:metal ABC transporter permease [Opitutaceae bacterium]
METLVPAFDFHRIFVAPWTTEFPTFGWIVLMGFLVGAACGLVGNYLLLRRLALMGDAVSHSVLPGLVVAFLLSNSRGTGAMFLGALAAGVLATLIIEVIHTKTRVKQDAAIGIAFSSLFAVGVLLTALYTSQVDLDAECVLYGEISFVPLEPMVEVAGLTLGPASLVRMALVLLGVVALVVMFYKELLVSAFDAGLARSLGVNPTAMHFGLMAVLSIVVVSAFEAVGAILVIAMLILPGATASLLTKKLPWVHAGAVVHAALSAVLGLHLGVWLECSLAPAMVVAGAGVFALAWVFGPEEGLIARWRRQRGGGPEPVRAP